jgi:hypothetical protein
MRLPRSTARLALLAVTGCTLTHGLALGPRAADGSRAAPAALSAPLRPSAPAPAATPDAVALIPEVAGLTEAEARLRLGAAGFGQIAVEHDVCEDDPRGARVCSTQPSAGSSANLRTPVVVNVADAYDRGRAGEPGEWARMPNLVGLSPDQASAALTRLGFDGEIEVFAVPGCAANTICRHEPGAGSRGMIHEPVGLYVTAPR